MSDTELVSLVALLRRGSLMQVRQRLLAGERPSDILRSMPDIPAKPGMSAEAIVRSLATGWRLLSFLDAEYPASLREAHDFPLVIGVNGDLLREDPAICVIGGRPGEAAEIGAQVARAGWTMVATPDTPTGRAALSRAAGLGGRTVGVTCWPGDPPSVDVWLSPLWPEPVTDTVTAYASAAIMLTGGEAEAAHILDQGRPVVFSAVAYNREAWARDLVNDPAVLAGMADTPEGMVAQAISLAERQI